MRHCSKCGAEKPLAEFYGPYGKWRKYSCYCKPCNNAYNRAWALAHPERWKYLQRKNDRQRGFRKKNPETVRVYNRRRALHRYGITERDYQALFEAQHGVCAICERPESYVRAGKVLRLAVDHDHATHRVRGLLCHACNRAVGMFQDSPVVLAKAAAYLLRQGADLQIIEGGA